jgi:hypothetical protein
VPEESVAALELFGISCIANILGAIKTAKYFELGRDDLVVTVATDSAELYRSRLEELCEARGPYTREQAARDYDALLLAASTDYYKELDYRDRKALHNLKYFTWVEQQGKTVAQLDRLWHDHEFWPQVFAQPARWDELIEEFNTATGLAPEAQS